MVPTKVLIVDDDSSIRAILAASLEAGGVQHIVEAATGAEALAILRCTKPPDVILLDVMMPGEDGPTVCARLKADPELARIPVIFLSAGGDHQKRRALDAGALGYLPKPFDPMRLVPAIASMLTAG